jgi:hypothetical protein
MKKLSDGTKAKVGLIVVVIKGKADGNDPGSVTEIVGLLEGTVYDKHVNCRAVGRFEYCVDFAEALCDLRIATPKEAAAYKE